MIKKLIKLIKKEEDGATSVEYSILVSLIAAVIILTVSSLGRKVVALFSSVANNW